MIGRGGNCATLKLPRSAWLAQDTLNVESEANGMFSVLDGNGSDTDEGGILWEKHTWRR